MSLRGCACENVSPWRFTENLHTCTFSSLLCAHSQDHDPSRYPSQFPCPSLNLPCSSRSKMPWEWTMECSWLLGIVLPTLGPHSQRFTHFFHPHPCVPVLALRRDGGLGIQGKGSVYHTLEIACVCDKRKTQSHTLRRLSTLQFTKYIHIYKPVESLWRRHKASNSFSTGQMRRLKPKEEDVVQSPESELEHPSLSQALGTPAHPLSSVLCHDLCKYFWIPPTTPTPGFSSILCT